MSPYTDDNGHRRFTPEERRRFMEERAAKSAYFRDCDRRALGLPPGTDLEDYAKRHQMQLAARLLKEERAEAAVNSGELGDPLVRLHCETRSQKGDECGRRVGRIYPYESTYVLVAKVYPSERRAAAAERIARSTNELAARTAEMVAYAHDTRQTTHLLDDWQNFILEPGKATSTLISCRTHGERWVEVSWLRDLVQAAKADPARRKVMVDIGAMDGVLPW